MCRFIFAVLLFLSLSAQANTVRDDDLLPNQPHPTDPDYPQLPSPNKPTPEPANDPDYGKPKPKPLPKPGGVVGGVVGGIIIDGLIDLVDKGIDKLLDPETHRPKPIPAPEPVPGLSIDPSHKCTVSGSTGKTLSQQIQSVCLGDTYRERSRQVIDKYAYNVFFECNNRFQHMICLVPDIAPEGPDATPSNPGAQPTSPPITPPQPLPEPQPQPQPLPEPNPDRDPNAKPNPDRDPNANPDRDPNAKPNPDRDPNANPDRDPNAKPNPDRDPNANPDRDPNAKPNPDRDPNANPDRDPNAKPNPDRDPNANPDRDPNGQPDPDKFKLPDFCVWASWFCDGDDPKKQDGEVNIEESDVPKNSVNINFGGSCPAPQSFGFSIAGRPMAFVLSYDSICRIAIAFGGIIKVLSTVVAIYILAGSK